MLEENVRKILAEIEKGNDKGEKITLVAATKTVDAERINLAIKCGVTAVAENRVQEFREKTGLIVGAEQQFIGHLQKNKVKYLVGKVSLIQSVDTFELCEEISKESVKKQVITNILAEVNVSGEESKSGLPFNEAKAEILRFSLLKNIKVSGIMTMMPQGADSTTLAELFKKARGLYDLLKKEGLPFKYLSMGMSGDYKEAIKNGSNMIRLGSAIFGERVYEVK